MALSTDSMEEISNHIDGTPKNLGLAAADVTVTKDQHNEDSQTTKTTIENRLDKQRVLYYNGA